MKRAGFLLAAAATGLLAVAAPARGVPICEPIKGTVAAQVQAVQGGLLLQGVLEGTLGGRPVFGSAITTLVIGPQDIEQVTNPVPAEGGSEMEIVEKGRTEPPRSLRGSARGMLVPTPTPERFLLVLHTRLDEGGSGEIHYQGHVEVGAGTAVWELSGAVCP